MIEWDRDTWRIQPKQIEEMVELWLNTGLSINAISKKMQISVTSVAKYLNMAGCNTSVIKPFFWTEDKLQYIIDHCTDGNKSIAQHFGKGMTANAIAHQKSLLRKKGYNLPRTKKQISF